MATSNESKPSFLRGREKPIALKSAALIAGIGLAASILSGCGPSASAEKGPEKVPTVSAPATPAASETATPVPAAIESSPAVHETDITSSEIFNKMTPADQALVEKDYKLSFDEFLKVNWKDRAKVSSVITEANIQDTLAKYRTNPDFGSYIDADYEVGKNPTPESIQSNTIGPVVNIWFKQATAFNMAATGDSQKYEDAKKIIAGTVHNASPADDGGGYTTKGYTEMMQELQDVYTAKEDTVNRYPGSAGGDNNQSPVRPGVYTVEIQNPDSTLVQWSMMNATFKLKDGSEQGDWTIGSLASPGDLGYYADLKHDG